MISYKKTKYRYFLLLLVLAAGIYNSLFYKKNKNYKESIENLRSHYNHYIKYYEDSPLEQDELTYFDKLDYFKIDEDYKIKAKLTKFDKKDTFFIKLTDTKTLKFLKYGQAEFIYNDEMLALTLLQHVGSNDKKLFVPFKDNTNGEYTYGAGRYMDVHYFGKSNLLLDFNLAYNPYCAYNSNYKCPIVPTENYLNVDIKAGEKAFNFQASNISE